MATRLVIFGTQTGLFSVYERAKGLSNNVRRLGRVQCGDWDQVTSGKVPIDPEAIEQFRQDPACYDPPPDEQQQQGPTAA